jgi:hypothetical protein
MSQSTVVKRQAMNFFDPIREEGGHLVRFENNTDWAELIGTQSKRKWEVDRLLPQIYTTPSKARIFYLLRPSPEAGLEPRSIEVRNNNITATFDNPGKEGLKKNRVFFASPKAYTEDYIESGNKAPTVQSAGETAAQEAAADKMKKEAGGQGGLGSPTGSVRQEATPPRDGRRGLSG